MTLAQKTESNSYLSKNIKSHVEWCIFTTLLWFSGSVMWQNLVGPVIVISLRLHYNIVFPTQSFHCYNTVGTVTDEKWSKRHCLFLCLIYLLLKMWVNALL